MTQQEYIIIASLLAPLPDEKYVTAKLSQNEFDDSKKDKMDIIIEYQLEFANRKLAACNLKFEV